MAKTLICPNPDCIILEWDPAEHGPICPLCDSVGVENERGSEGNNQNSH